MIRPGRPAGQNADFIARLTQACDELSGHIPAHGEGQQTFIQRKIGVSREAVSKWFSGDSRPSPNYMRELAAILDVDEAWLSLGAASEIPAKERRARNAEADGAVNLVAGLIQMNGGTVAFPSNADKQTAYIDMYAIIRAAQFGIHVALAREVSPRVYKVNVPLLFEDCTIVGVVRKAPLRVDLLNMTHSMIERHKVREGPAYEIQVKLREAGYMSGSDLWSRIENFRDRL
jgi:transcriptional regulator with XRE-family HTH domain